MESEHPYLDNLYVGNLNPNENLHPAYADYSKLQKEACDLEDQVKDKLTPLDRDLFHAMLNARGRVSSMEVCEAFAEGYRIATNLLLEALGCDINFTKAG